MANVLAALPHHSQQLWLLPALQRDSPSLKTQLTSSEVHSSFPPTDPKHSVSEAGTWAHNQRQDQVLFSEVLINLQRVTVYYPLTLMLGDKGGGGEDCSLIKIPTRTTYF